MVLTSGPDRRGDILLIWSYLLLIPPEKDADARKLSAGCYPDKIPRIEQFYHV